MVCCKRLALSSAPLFTTIDLRKEREQERFGDSTRLGKTGFLLIASESASIFDQHERCEAGLKMNVPRTSSIPNFSKFNSDLFKAAQGAET